MLFDNLIVVADKPNLRVHLREVDQVKVLLELLGLFGLLLALHVDQRDILLLDRLPLLILVGLQYDFVLSVDHLCRVHLVVELVRVPQLCLQFEALDDLVLVLEVTRPPLVVLALLQDAEVLPIRQLASFLVHASRQNIPDLRRLVSFAHFISQKVYNTN